jgi:hypothetical protein
MLSTSLKTTILLVALAGALAAVAFTSRRETRHAWSGSVHFKHAAAILGGILVAPLLLLAFYYQQGALPSLIQETVFHNYVPKLGHWKNWKMAWFFLPEVAALFWISLHIGRTSPSVEVRQRRIFVFLAGGLYLTLLVNVWPLLAPESFLPFYPIAGLFLTALVFAGAHLFPRSREVFAGILVAVEVAAIAIIDPPWHQGTAAETKLLADVLRLTGPDEYVMDGKGETVFRRRPFFPIFEHITRNRIGLHLTVDSMPGDLIATRTCVVTTFHPFTKQDSTFIDQHYLPVGPLSVAGQILTAASPEAALDFEVVIPASYVIISENGAVIAELDGKPYTGVRFLEAGRHELRMLSAAERLAIVWSRAVELGYSPFREERWTVPVVY